MVLIQNTATNNDREPSVLKLIEKEKRKEQKKNKKQETWSERDLRRVSTNLNEPEDN